MSFLSNPHLYNFVQDILGGHRSRIRLQQYFDTFPPGALILDLGGGTGAIAPYLPRDSRYICLDRDPAKLEGLRGTRWKAGAVLSDAANVPVRSASIDVVLSIAVSHHLSDMELHGMLQEIRRVLKSDGQLLFLDPLAGPRVATRLMWSIDRGSHPRSPEALCAALGRHMSIVREVRHTELHEYLTVIAIKNSQLLNGA